MVTKDQQYDPVSSYLFLYQKRKQIAQIKKKISKFGIGPNELEIFFRGIYRLADEKKRYLIIKGLVDVNQST